MMLVKNKTMGAPNGSLPIALGGEVYTVWGGPYRNRPESMAGVKMAVEIKEACDVDVPTRDFNVPDQGDLIRGLAQTVNLLLDGKTVYVGCMGGIGRTGLFLAALAKLSGVEDPVAYVREHYIPHAVETDQQQRFIRDLDLSELRRRVLSALWWRRWFGWVPRTDFKVRIDGL